MQHIIEGFLNFQKEIFPQRKELFRSLALSQNPKALFISCSDSRLVPELVTQQEPGQLFVIRNAGNIVPSFRAGARWRFCYHRICRRCAGRDGYRDLRPLQLRRDESDRHLPVP